MSRVGTRDLTGPRRWELYELVCGRKMSCATAARRLGASPFVVRSAMKRMRLPFHGGHGGLDLSDDFLREFREQVARPGSYCAKVARHFGMRGNRARSIATRLGLEFQVKWPSKRKGVSKKRDETRRKRERERVERQRRIIARRSEIPTPTYAEIGAEFGISGERVRQVIRAAGRADLTRRRSTYRVWRCECCGRAERRLKKADLELKYCSDTCAAEARRRLSVEKATTGKTNLRFGPRILAMTREGMTYIAIANELGIEGPNDATRAVKCCNILKRWADLNGVDRAACIAEARRKRSVERAARGETYLRFGPEILAMRREGMTYSAIADELGFRGVTAASRAGNCCRIFKRWMEINNIDLVTCTPPRESAGG